VTSGRTPESWRVALATSGLVIVGGVFLWVRGGQEPEPSAAERESGRAIEGPRMEPTGSGQELEALDADGFAEFWFHDETQATLKQMVEKLGKK